MVRLGPAPEDTLRCSYRSALHARPRRGLLAYARQAVRRKTALRFKRFTHDAHICGRGSRSHWLRIFSQPHSRCANRATSADVGLLPAFLCRSPFSFVEFVSTFEAYLLSKKTSVSAVRASNELRFAFVAHCTAYPTWHRYKLRIQTGRTDAVVASPYGSQLGCCLLVFSLRRDAASNLRPKLWHKEKGDDAQRSTYSNKVEKNRVIACCNGCHNK